MTSAAGTTRIAGHHAVACHRGCVDQLPSYGSPVAPRSRARRVENACLDGYSICDLNPTRLPLYLHTGFRAFLRTGTGATFLIVLLLTHTACSEQSESADSTTPVPPATLPAMTAPPPVGPPAGSSIAPVTSAPAAGDAAPVPTVPASGPAETSVSPARTAVAADRLEIVAFAVPRGSRPHDVAPAPDGGVWYTAQNLRELGWLDPATGATRHIPLGIGSRPHGVIVGPDGAPWVTDGGLNAIVRVDPATQELSIFPLPPDRANANLNTGAFDGAGRLWFTGQNGIHGVLDPKTGTIDVFDSPRGRGPYGISATPLGDVYFASLAGSYVGLIAPDGSVTVPEPPTPGQGARRVWSDSAGSIWVSEWNSGQLSRYTPETQLWST